MNKELLFSVTIKDCDVQTFRAGGKGGQHQNKTETGVRIIHRASGAVGEARDERSQHMNKKNAFLRMARSEKFKTWHRLECARRLGLPSVDEIVDDQMSEKNLRIDYV
jgi:protein subunit release factor A